MTRQRRGMFGFESHREPLAPPEVFRRRMLRSGSVAERVGFRVGDIIVSADEQKVATVLDLEQLLKKRPTLWRMWIKRGRQTLQLQIPG